MTDPGPRPARPFAASPAPKSPLPPGELQVRISCRDRRADDVLDDLRRALAEAGAQGRDPLIVLEELGRLADSIMTLMKGISRQLVGYPRTVTFWESSGFTEAYLSAMEKQDPPAAT